MGVSSRSTAFFVIAIAGVAICLYLRSKRSCASGDDDEPPTYTSSSSSESERLDTSSPPRGVPRSPSPVPDTQHGVEVEAVSNAQEMRAARELRERARRCKREMHVARDLAKSTRRSGDYQAEQRHQHDARAYESQMKDLDKRAAKIIFRENNKAQKEGTVDLHGLYVSEALEYAKKELQSATYRNDGKVCFIVGRGLHSDGGQSKLRPRLQGFCDERGLAYSLDPRNPGKLIVQLH